MAEMDDPRRRRRGPASSGYGGIGGAETFPGQILPFLTGVRGESYGGGGLMAFLQAMASGGQQAPSPAFRNFQNQGFDFLPPGLDNRNAPGGGNVAPGNIDDNLALDQPQANPNPGVPRGVPFGNTPPGLVGPQNTQGWRNYAPGFREAAKLGYGTPEFGSHFGLGEASPPGAVSPGGPGFRDVGRGPGGGGGGQAPAPGPRAAAGGGAGEFGPRPSMGPGPGGGGGPRPAAKGPGEEFRPGGRSTGGPSQASANRAQVRAGTASGGEKVGPKQITPGNINKNTGGPQTNAGQAVLFGPGVGGPRVEVAPQGGAGGKGVGRKPNQPLHKAPPKPTYTPPTPPPAKPKPRPKFTGSTKPRPRPRPSGGTSSKQVR